MGPNKSMEEMVKEIYVLLKGQEIDKNDRGMIGDVADLTKKVNAFEKWKDKTVAWALGFSFGSGALISGIIAFLINKHN